MPAIDLRSDTVTQPTAAMRHAMAEAEVGDDVFGEDPTVNRLEAMAAKQLGKPAALFVASGTMANLISQMAHCNRGDEIIVGDQAHIFIYEQGGTAAVGGIHSRAISNQANGQIDLDAIEAAIRPDNIHFPRTRLIALENTHNRCFGSPLDLDYMRAAGALAKKHTVKLHVDGARIFNAATALGVTAAKLAAEADSISFCLSKGLGAPVGSLICGNQAFIDRARRLRKVLGGGMRQAGVLAAAGILALTEMVVRLADDHKNAAALAAGLAEFKGLSINVNQVKTNLVFFETTGVMTAEDLRQHLAMENLLVLAVGPKRLRAVTHYQITDADIDQTLEIFKRVLG
jgi:threonine aldolase